jgi:rare lipoprotein A
MRSKVNAWGAAALFLLGLAGCSGSRDFGAFPGDEAPPSAAGTPVGTAGLSISDLPVKLGEPYQVDGRTYTPQDVGSYDEVGYASWYGPELAGNSTANGELFNPQGVSAAHKTLPLPTYVEVTALDTGRTILVRVNDRGPFANDRLIDLSLGAAQQLGIADRGVSGVRVRKVNPNEQEKAILRAGGQAIERVATPDSLLSILRTNLGKLPTPKLAVAPTRPPVSTGNTAGKRRPAAPTAPGARDGRFIVEDAGGAPTPASPPPTAATRRPSDGQQAARDNLSGGLPVTYVVQIAAFGSKARADSLAKSIGAVVMPNADRSIWRVRYGPYADEDAAQVGLAQAKARGYDNASVMRADTP